jgi:predicted anti-sigma-YlaC factor YlaD
MECGACREALSARLDGEPEPVPAAEVDEHLAGCEDCQAWYTDAVVLTRRVRVREVTPTPDLVAAVMAEAHPQPRRRPWARIALAGIGLVQLLLAVAQLFGTQVHAHNGGEVLTGHLINEGAAWNLALGLAMLAAAWQTGRAVGLLPAVAVFVLALVVFSLVDLMTSGVPGSRLLSHIPLVAGLALLYLVHRQDKQDRDPAPASRGSAGDEERTAGEPRADEPKAEQTGDNRQARPNRPWLRPAGHRRAA